MKEKQQLVIILPECLADLPIQIVRSLNYKELVFALYPSDGQAVYAESREKKYVFIWRHEDYLKVALEEIQWIEAAKSYSVIHMTRNRKMTVSFNLAIVKKELPDTDFIRIHRSYIVNLRHIETLIGNSLKIGSKLLTIGREYKKAFLDRIIFLGIRRTPR